MNPANGHVLLVCTGPVSALVQAFPAVTEVRERRPGLKLDWLVDAQLVDLPRLHPGVQRVIGVQPGAWSGVFVNAGARAALRATRQQLRAQRYDLVIDLDGRHANMPWLLQTRAPVVGWARADCPDPLTALLYRRSSPMPADWPPHERPRLLCALQLGLPVPEKAGSFSLVPPQAPWQPPVLGVGVLAGPMEDDPWPDTHWRALGTRLRQAHLSPVWLSTDFACHARAVRLAAATDGSAPPPLEPAALTAVLAAMRLVVARGADAAWLATATGRRTLALLAEADRPAPRPPRAMAVAAGPHAPRLESALALLEQMLTL